MCVCSLLLIYVWLATDAKPSTHIQSRSSERHRFNFFLSLPCFIFILRLNVCVPVYIYTYDLIYMNEFIIHIEMKSMGKSKKDSATARMNQTKKKWNYTTTSKNNTLDIEAYCCILQRQTNKYITFCWLAFACFWKQRCVCFFRSFIFFGFCFFVRSLESVTISSFRFSVSLRLCGSRDKRDRGYI